MPRPSPKSPLAIFAHGAKSDPCGHKIAYLAAIANDHGYAAVSLDYQGISELRSRVAKLVAEAPAGAPRALVGSSIGGYGSVMACARLAPVALWLLAPALYRPGYPGEPNHCPDDTVVVDGWRDDVAPRPSSVRFARSAGAALHLLDDDHRLTASLPVIGDIFARQLGRAVGAG